MKDNNLRLKDEQLGKVNGGKVDRIDTAVSELKGKLINFQDNCRYKIHKIDGTNIWGEYVKASSQITGEDPNYYKYHFKNVTTSAPDSWDGYETNVEIDITVSEMEGIWGL